MLPDNVATLLAEVLAPFGYVEPVVREYVKTEGGDNYWHDLKQAALANLDRWVPDLGLPKTYKLGVNWRAVAEWRGVKNTNLSFHPDGITDWGSGEGYTPIDVVMAALKYDDATKAAEWLEDRLKFTLTAANDKSTMPLL